MKNRVILALAALSFAASMIGASATAQERNELSRSAADLSRMLGPPAGSALAEGGLPLHIHPKAEALEQRAIRADDEDALVAGLSSAMPVIPAASLVGTDLQPFLRSPGGQQAGSGFAPIKAALAGQIETGGLLSRSADPASLLYLYAPPK